MKYPQEQFEVLKSVIAKIAEHANVRVVGIHELHFMVFQQFSAGQKHNRFVVSPEGVIKRKFSLKEGNLVENEGQDLISTEYDFQLYPEGCHDSHVETAMNKALKELGITE